LDRHHQDHELGFADQTAKLRTPLMMSSSMNLCYPSDESMGQKWARWLSVLCCSPNESKIESFL
uniref:PDEase domain-containing protein n=1 Tax=Gongylonema pulchrum TaxID=637853 RepID=A0A183EZL3_9BILA